MALPLLVTGFGFYHTQLYVRLVNLSGDAEKNRGIKSYQAQYLANFHRKLNSIAAHNLINVALVKTYLSVHNMDFVCLSETHLDSSVPTDDDNEQNAVYTFVKDIKRKIFT